MTAAGVPIAVPNKNCRKYIHMSKFKDVVFVIVIMAEMTVSEGKPSGSRFLSSKSLIHQVITVMAWSVSMLLFIDIASVVKSRALDGKSS